MDESGIEWPADAAWVWSAAAGRAYHNVVLFRRAFDAASPGAAVLHVTADTRYEIHLNGQWLGFGPARAWPWRRAVDDFDVAGLLRPGRNVLAVRVAHVGISTFQSLHASPGLLAALSFDDAGGRTTVVTDGHWKCLPSAADLWPVPRINCMQGWEEQFDARRSPGDWTAVDFDDAAWHAATSVDNVPARPVRFPLPVPRGRVREGAGASSGFDDAYDARAASLTLPRGTGRGDPSGRRFGESAEALFVLRGVPQLTRDPVPPVAVLAVEAVRPPDYAWTVNPRDLLNPHDKSANFVRGRMLLVTTIESDREQPIELHQPTPQAWCDWTLNGVPLSFDDKTRQLTETGVAHATLPAGRNTLVGRLPVQSHYWWAQLGVWTESPVVWQSPVNGDTPWASLGPFGDATDDEPPEDGMGLAYVRAAAFPPGATAEAFERVWQSGPTAADFAAAYARPVPTDAVAGDDVYVRCAGERVVPGAPPCVDDADVLTANRGDRATIRPCATGDVRLLLDFGREVVGFHEFDIDAPAGCVIDVHNFEFIQPDGRFNLCEGANNCFRYICREGVQAYRTTLRRGFRYSFFSVRNFDRPVRLRGVRVLMSTYPQARQGRFECSDPLLNAVWDVGAHSVACCSEDAYTDCPSYEQTFWVGDGRNEALVDLYANGDPRLSARSLRLAAGSLTRSPVVESQVPSGWQNVLPAWNFLWMRWAEEHVRLTGDFPLARELVDANARQISAFRAAVGPLGLIKMLAWNLFDWAGMDTPPDGTVTHVNCLAVLGLRQSAALARMAGRDDLAGEWGGFAGELADAVNRHLWSDDREAFLDCLRADGTPSPVFSQQTQTAALIGGVAGGGRADRCRQIMHAAPAGFVTAGSPFFMSFLLEALAGEGRFAELLDVIRRYWGPQIEAGATTFWETYSPHRPRWTRSHCHGWSAAPTYFLSRHVLGVSPAGPGFARVRVAPEPGGLRWARGAVPTPRGVVEVEWTAGGELRVMLPADTPADVEWPGKVVLVPSPGTPGEG